MTGGRGAGPSVPAMGTKRPVMAPPPALSASSHQSGLPRNPNFPVYRCFGFAAGAIRSEVYGKRFRQAAAVTGFSGAAFCSCLPPRFELRCSC